MAITSLREGDNNSYVLRMQQILVDLKYFCGGTPDGKFDRATTWAVKWFQFRNGLTVDGICGVKTRDKMLSSSAETGVPSAYNSWRYGIIPLRYKMNDNLWKNYPYDAKDTSTTETIGTSGCGPTTMASILSTLLGMAIVPPILSDWALKKNYRDPKGEDGTYPNFFKVAASTCGLKTATIEFGSGNRLASTDFETVDQALKANSLIAASVNSRSPYTQGGHYLMIYKIADGKVYVRESNGNNDDIEPKPISQWINGQWANRFIRVYK